MQAALYRFLLDYFNIRTTRAADEDTDWAAVNLSVNGTPVPSQAKKIGDVDYPNNPVRVGLVLDAVCGLSEAQIDYAFLIQNLGYHGTSTAESKKALDWVSGACKDIITAAFGLAKVWDEVDTIVQDINEFIFANCDGAVAADKISWTGRELADAVAITPGRTVSYHRDYPGKDSPNFCGANSFYTVYWSVTQLSLGDVVWITNRSSNKVLQIPAGAVDDGVKIEQYHATRSANQAWIAAPTQDGYMQIINTASNKLIDVPGSAAGNGVLMQQYRENGGGDNQKWRLLPTDNGFVKIQSLATGKVLDVNGSSAADGLPIQQWEDNGGGANQQWRLTPVPLVISPPGITEKH